jgi:hypothetical protein
MPLLLAIAPVFAHPQMTYAVAEVTPMPSPSLLFNFKLAMVGEQPAQRLAAGALMTSSGISSPPAAWQAMDAVLDKARQLLWMLTRKLHLLLSGKLMVLVESEVGMMPAQEDEGIGIPEDAAIPVS